VLDGLRRPMLLLRGLAKTQTTAVRAVLAAWISKTSVVRQVTGRSQSTGVIDWVSADTLNRNYARISSDADYQPTERKHTVACERQEFVSEWRVFTLLDKLPATASGMDQLPAWFFRIGAPAFYKPITRLFSMCIESSTLSYQWKHASICPVPKTSTSYMESDYWPISITSVLARILERIVVKDFLYPALITPPAPLSFSDQYAFRPTGSTIPPLWLAFCILSQTYCLVTHLWSSLS